MVDEKNSITEQWWNATDKEILMFSEKILPHSHFVYHKSHVDWLGLSTCILTFHLQDTMHTT
jgi:hypothetical protein